MSCQCLHKFCAFFRKIRKWIFVFLIFVITCLLISLAIAKIYEQWDKDPDRGAIGITDGYLNESYTTPVYLPQGWNASDSLWFYNTTQGSNLIPYDFYLSLNEAGTTRPFIDNAIYDKYRYLPQKPTFFNPDGLAVGFVKDTYQGKDYIGYTCAACHTGQINYQGKAIRIDGGPAMADMVGYLDALQQAMQEALTSEPVQTVFIQKVLDRKNNYDTAEEVLRDLQKWTEIVASYNHINFSHLKYGYARLDAFGRIYNRVLQHVINKDQARHLLLTTTNAKGERLLTKSEVTLVLEGVNETVIGNEQFSLIMERLQSTAMGYPGLSFRDMLRIRQKLFNEPNAPVSYPFLWDITHSDYVQWNGLADNAGVGPLGRNAGEVIGVFATLDWSTNKPGFSLSAKISGQESKKTSINFKSSVDLWNLQRLENHLKSLQSPKWPEDILGTIDREKAERGQLLYAEHCQSCHEVIDRDDWDRLVIAKLDRLDVIGTDPKMAENSVNYAGKAGNFKHTYQSTGVGDYVMGEEAPVAMILTAATTGVVTTPDPDKWVVRRWADWLYTLLASVTGNEIQSGIKQGTYEPDTTAEPYRSLLSYKARSLNGIWATAPYLHNGSVPTLYDLLLPVKPEGATSHEGYRPARFEVGVREFDPVKVGYETQAKGDAEGFIFNTAREGNYNTGHNYGTELADEERLEIVEYLKTL